MGPVVRAVARCLDRQAVAPAAHAGVACSGGSDSAGLARAAAALLARGRLARVTLIHVDHQLRADSAADATAVERLAAALGVGFHGERATVERRRSSLEDAARRARYAAFERAIAALELEALLLAHTADDQAETVLMRLVRGTGVAGLAAMAERRGPYLRPLLDLGRAAVAADRERHGVAALDDPMNHDHRFTRVRVRHTLVPDLVAENPRAVAALGRLAHQAGALADLLDWAAGRLLAEAAGPGDRLLAARLAAAPSAVVRHALARAATAAGLGPLAASHVEALHRLATGTAGSQSIALPGGTAVREYDQVGFVPANAAVTAPPDLSVCGPEMPYTVRALQPGDRMRPVRLRGRSRKLSDLYTDLRVPRAVRAVARVVTDPAGAIVWAEHIGPAWKTTARVSLTGVGGVARNKN